MVFKPCAPEVAFVSSLGAVTRVRCATSAFSLNGTCRSRLFVGPSRRGRTLAMTLKPPQDQKEGKAEESQTDSAPSWRFPAVSAVWIGYIAFVLLLGPGDLELGSMALIFEGRFSEVNRLFLAAFLSIGGLGGVYLGLLVPGASKQVRFDPFLAGIAGMFFGILGLGPYLAAREYVPSVSQDELKEKGPLYQFAAGRVFGVSVFLYALYVYYTALGLYAPSYIQDVIFFSNWQDFLTLVGMDRGVAGSVLDTCLLSSLLLWGPLTEDMQRRGWKFDSQNVSSYLNAFCIMAAPLLGPAFYLVIRPGLPQGRNETKI